MKIAGKLIGLVSGLLLTGGNVWTGLLGILIGHLFDRGGLGGPKKLTNAKHWAAISLLQDAPSARFGPHLVIIYCEVLFLLLGRIAKLDGRVSEGEILWVEQLMQRMNISGVVREECIDQFRQGKQLDNDIGGNLSSLYWQIYPYERLRKQFVEILVEAIYVDDMFNRPGWLLILEVAAKLKYPEAELWQLRHRYEDRGAQNYNGTQTHNQQSTASSSQESQYRQAEADEFQSSSQQHQDGFEWSRMGRASSRLTEAQALTVLGITAIQWQTYNKKMLKRTYRQLMSRHHPDKLMASGATSAEIESAKSRTQAIRSAYDRLSEML